MFTGLAARRIAAVVTGALVAVLLVTFGGPTRASAQRLTFTGASQAGTPAKATRVQQALPLVHQHHAPQHLDLATMLPGSAPDVRSTVGTAAADAVVVHTGTDLVAPTGRAPPAL